MQEISNKEFIDKVEKYMQQKKPFLEVEIVEDIKKKQIAYSQFSLPLSMLKEISIFQNIYMNFSVLQIKNSYGKTIGIQLLDDQQEVFQFCSYDRKKLDDRINHIDQYFINTKKNQFVLELQNTTSTNRNLFAISMNSLSTNQLLQEVLMSISQQIDKLFGIESENIKIYQIHRK